MSGLEEAYAAPPFVDSAPAQPCPDSGALMYREVAFGLQVWVCGETNPCGPCGCPSDDCYCLPPTTGQQL